MEMDFSQNDNEGWTLDADTIHSLWLLNFIISADSRLIQVSAPDATEAYHRTKCPPTLLQKNQTVFVEH